ncbi:Multidrug resistance protein MdtC [Arenibacter antarcticus]|uniref:CusA/CzcA family heavy metal efflux RND transporter n=1 Tax=Arenibacter antarcticus TaxID=2040469 RepID=A0ABW5VF75_9FLAO|nr:CusA/CzcA family heavy metal efflux RND transporter [Arenibacter sp. H213]MCM4168209.1 CusA/CzcA family heavy metal efflux RND transporter [Arenibacter sp. H213]
MLSNIIQFSLKNKLIVLLFTLFIIGFGLYSITQIPIGAVPDITNNQVQVITTSKNLSTQDMEQFITYPVELEMANLPGVVEIRSVSKFGLSVVTIVFEDKMGTYLPRQLISEKLISASEKIPEGFGTPEMGPITTGLGEIYQYILDTKPGYEDKYSLMELRTIQDWVVKRQLSGIPGVVEVNTWGGQLKQYEVAINTNKLNAMNVTMADIFTALEKNNSVSGGGYIEKVNQAYFIRGDGLISSLEDIRNIAIKTTNSLPVYIKDIAEVSFGSATRFGAITGNGEGEKVLGQIMMLKDANSKKVIDAVHERIDLISESLPEGVYINGFLERNELIQKTTYTISENLILGCLIVIFVVVLLLGNLRSGLVVASVIPLCLLFALSMMYIFKVDANLMSLGAIDFGIIIDGAVIIVEYIAYQMTTKRDELANVAIGQRQELKNKITFQGASKMMNSAIFGQLIILIVFIPILSLSGVEGKMFKPMALTFSFALLGAMLLCFTYVPVAASLWIKPSDTSSKNISVRLMALLNRGYDPVIKWSLSHKKVVLSISALLLAGSVYLFTTMGGEFVPTLDEGDFVIQPVLKTGTSLSKTVEITTRIEQILLDNFPEVKQVITRIGAAEVPTDPMSMEESDVIITLKNKKEWVSAETKDELADKFKEALSVIPGMEVEFTQPIEMRFNELITGVRADIAIKIFGEDLEILQAKGNEIKNLIQNVEGAADIIVEKVAGLPQMNVKFDRSKIARYGLNIADLNQIISMGFAGANLGSVFEGEQRFDLTLRLDKESRNDISSLKNLYVDTPSGQKIPLSELANITYTEGAAKISRDDTKRRIVVGVNVRNRDLQSVVDDVQNLIDNTIKLPVGYTIDYGGQFENLQSAKDRLMIAVPVALILIFILLYFAFKSVKEALLIYSAIPLSAVGGILLLWIRDMPFSISAGVGFIALFGIAVLNGIVLIEHFKELKFQGMEQSDELIVQGSKDRLRAVLLTASAAALGFLPMAISTNVGAEVQRPLATVVIGGLISATILTLVVLPILYSLYHKKDKKNMNKLNINKNLLSSILLIMLGAGAINAQDSGLNYDEIRSLALRNNTGLKAANLKVDESKAFIGSAFSFDKTEVYYQYDQNNMAYNNELLKVYGIQQNFLFPTIYFAEKGVNKALYEIENSAYAIKLNSLQQEVASAYHELQYSRQKEKTYGELNAIYERFSYAAQRRYELGESNYLEKITAQAKQKELQALYKKAVEDAKIALYELSKTVQPDSVFVVKTMPMEKLKLDQTKLEENKGIQYFENRNKLFNAKSNLEQQHLLPDFSINYFQATNANLGENLYGFQVGVKIPLFFSGNASKIKAAKIAKDVASKEMEDYTIHLKAKYESLLGQLNKYREVLSYYENEGQGLADEIIKTATLSYQSGEIDFFQYIQSMENGYQITLSYLANLNAYNQTIIAINYLNL